jgi:cobalt-zinc-cadmium efflux system membrane fusion protein
MREHARRRLGTGTSVLAGCVLALAVNSAAPAWASLRGQASDDGHSHAHDHDHDHGDEAVADAAADQADEHGHTHDDGEETLLTPRTKRTPEIHCTKTDALVTLASADIARTVDLAFERARVEEVSGTFDRSAEIAYDGNRYARLSSRAPGVVAEVLHDLGDRIEAGEVLAIVDSVELGAAKAEWLQSRELTSLWERNAQRERTLVDAGAGIEREALEAETRHAEARIAEARARQKLRSLGLDDVAIDEVGRSGDTSSRLRVTAPFAGVVVERSAVIGEVVESSEPLFAVADTGVMWAMIDMQESDLRVARPGQEVIFTADGLRDEPFFGRLTWISTAVDPTTRTIKARAELDNGIGLLRAHMFGSASVQTREEDQAVTVPKAAVQWEGCCNVVFVRANEEGTLFRPKKVQLGVDSGDRFEVLRGLEGGEMLATRGSYLLKTELMKESIGAGCCEVDHLAK